VTVQVPTKAAKLAIGFNVLAAVTFVLLVFGATVRVHGAGLSCPDWPLCFGQVVPELDFHVSLEWGHRVLASLVSLGFLGLGGAVLADPELRARAGRWVGLAAVTLGVQVVLGGLTVLHLLADWSVTLHLLTGNFFLFLVLSLGVRVADRPAVGGAVPPLARVLVPVLFLLWFAQMGLGGLVASNHAGTACSEFPTCNGGVWFPTWSGIVGLQIVHRLGAYTVALVTLALAVVAWRDAGIGRHVRGLTGLVALQIGLGVVNVWWGVPVETAVAHSAVGDLIGVVLVYTLWNVLRRRAAVLASHARVVTVGTEQHA